VRILVHDYAGHPFQVQLSRELGRRGHQVWHLSSADVQTPKGRLESDADSRDRLTVLDLSLGQGVKKDSFIRRRSQEIAFGRLVAANIARIRPDVVISGNAPLDTQYQILRATRRENARFVFWVQDIYSEAVRRILSSRWGLAGQAIGRFYHALEYRMLRSSDAIVVISPDFTDVLTSNGAPAERISVIENWAPLDDNPCYPPAHRSVGAPVQVLYAGTLGYKHNPDLLFRAAQIPGVEMRVYSEGRVAEALQARAAEAPALSVHKWVPAEQLAATLASADILTAIIEADASDFSVPSKLLTYLCAGRAIAAAVPKANLGARILERAGAGLVCAPEDSEGFLANIRTLAADGARRRAMGERGRRYAEATFCIERIADQFEAVLRG
jgi:colanic acid biosynthesis glycosyl transferase WcaI